MHQRIYRQCCPVAMACEILCSRWTVLVLRELLAGSTRFNQLRMGVPRMSPALLAKRLRELERAGLVHRIGAGRGAPEYRLTDSGEDLRPVLRSLGTWGQRWLHAHCALEDLDPVLLMWQVRRSIDPRPLPRRRCVMQFFLTDAPPAPCNYWLVIDPDRDVDLLLARPKREVDLHVRTDVRTMTAIWMGRTTLGFEVDARKVQLRGPRELAASMHRWLGRSPYG